MGKVDDLISIIVPVYNVEHYLERCVESITNQTYKNLEIILVDDGSTDGSGVLCDELAAKDPRIIVIHQKNQGLGPARNSGLKQMRGKYVGFVDSDDWIQLNTYEILYESIVQYDCDVATCGRIIISDEGELNRVYCLDKGRKLEGDQIVKHFLLQQDMNMSAGDKLYKSFLFSDIMFPGEFYVSEDILPIYNVLKRANGVYQTGKPFYYYYYRIGSLSRSEFTSNSIGTYRYARAVADNVRSEYPALLQEADFFEYDGMISVFRLIRKSNYKGNERDELFKALKKNVNVIFKNRCLYKRHKIYVFLAILHLDRIADKVYLEIKQVIYWLQKLTTKKDENYK